MFPLVLIEVAQMVHYRTLLEITADGRIGEQGKYIIGFTEPVGDGIVSLLVIELMMIFIMCGCPCEGGKAIKKGDPDVRKMIQEGRLPDRHMVVVVGYHRYSDGQVQGQYEQDDVESYMPLYKKQTSSEQKVNQGLNVRSMFEHRAKR